MNTIQPLLLPCNGSLDLTLVELTEKVNNLESKILSLFIGLAEIERMPCDREHIIFKMMIIWKLNLSNSGFRDRPARDPLDYVMTGDSAKPNRQFP